MALSLDQVAALALARGVSRTQAITMTSIAPPESGLDPTAVGDAYPINGIMAESVGVWMIRTLTERITTAKQNGEIGEGTREAFIKALKNPTYNSIWMKRILDSQGYSAWSVYPSKSASHVPAAREAVERQAKGDRWKETVKALPNPNLGETGIDLNPIDDIAAVPGEVAGMIMGWLGPGLARAGLLAGGAVLIGVMLLAFLWPVIRSSVEAVT